MNKSIPFSLALLFCIPNAYAEGTFAGPYLGIQMGYVWGDDSGKEYSSGSLDGYSQVSNLDGGLYGVYGGYNFIFSSNYLAGIEGDFEGRIGTDEDTFQKSSGVIDTTYPYKAESNMAGSIRGRLGYIFNGRSLLYATGGYAGVEVKRAFYDTSTPGVSSSSTDWQSGWTAGAGVEHIFSPCVSAKLEYRYSDYGEQNVDTSAVYGAGYIERQSFEEHSIRAGVSYRFK